MDREEIMIGRLSDDGAVDEIDERVEEAARSEAVRQDEVVNVVLRLLDWPR